MQLVHAYQEALGRDNIAAAQILLTPEDTENRRRFLNARGTLGRLLERGVVPIINENDTVATEEIRYGDNDRLAARVAQLVMADALILLSDVDGFYTADPGKDPDAEHIAEVRSISDDMLAMANSRVAAAKRKGFKKAQLLDADSINVIFLVVDDPFVYHKFSVAQNNVGISRKLALRKLFRPATGLIKGVAKL